MNRGKVTRVRIRRANAFNPPRSLVAFCEITAPQERFIAIFPDVSGMPLKKRHKKSISDIGNFPGRQNKPVE